MSGGVLNYEELALDLRESLGNDAFDLFAADDELFVSVADNTIARVTVNGDTNTPVATLEIAADCPPQVSAYLAVALDALIETRIDLEHTFTVEEVAIGERH